VLLAFQAAPRQDAQSQRIATIATPQDAAQACVLRHDFAAFWPIRAFGLFRFRCSRPRCRFARFCTWRRALFAVACMRPARFCSMTALLPTSTHVRIRASAWLRLNDAFRPGVYVLRACRLSTPTACRRPQRFAFAPELEARTPRAVPCSSTSIGGLCIARGGRRGPERPGPRWLRVPGFHPLARAPCRSSRQPDDETIQNKGSFEIDRWNFRISREQQHWTQSLLTVRGPLQQDVAVQEAPMPFRESAGHGVLSRGHDWFSVTRSSLV